MRLREFQKTLAKNRIGLALFFSLDGENTDPNLVYFTQYTGFGALAITPKKAVLVVPLAEKGRARRTSRIRVAATKEKLVKTVKQMIMSRPRKIGIDKNRTSVNFYRRLRKELKGRYVDISAECLRLRTRKTKEEIAIIRKACSIADGIMHKTLWNFRHFRTEAEVAAFMANETAKLGLCTAFKTIVASGSNACEAHHEPENGPLRNGFCVIDFGVRYKGYCSDISRTIYLGMPTPKETGLYHKVLEVQQRLIKECRAGRSFIAINKKAHELFGKHSKNFTHLIGHGIGTEIHENPNPKQTPRRPVTRLLAGSVITIEPGIYFDKRLGIRIEDDILITRKGHEVLTKTGKNLLIIKKRYNK
jgi:Xaa-Pro aminopeptidase